jgi:phenylpropionate dioxygenase-like ring-hydroxylating dioxygenase large terminal subunit
MSLHEPAPSAVADPDPGANRSSAITSGFRPGRFALRDAWFPVLHSKLLRRRTVRRAIHGEPIFLSRENGLAVAHEDSPADRERGRFRRSAFTGGSGRWPTFERSGYVWVWYGDTDAASTELVPNLPHMPEKGMPRFFGGNVIFDCSYELICENLLDLTHFDFLHSALTGDTLSETDEITVTSTSETVTQVRRAVNRAVPKAHRWFNRAKSQDLVATTLMHVRSGVCVLNVDWDPGMDIYMVHPANPESAYRTRTTYTFNPQHCVKPARFLFPTAAHVVGSQDNYATKPQNELYQGTRTGAETGIRDMNSRFDAAGLRYRKVYQELVARQQIGDFGYRDDGHPGRDIRSELNLNRVRKDTRR